MQSDGSEIISAKARIFTNAKSLRFSPKSTCGNFAHLYAIRKLHTLTNNVRRQMQDKATVRTMYDGNFLQGHARSCSVRDKSLLAQAMA
jgi:hypothetical protein